MDFVQSIKLEILNLLDFYLLQDSQHRPNSPEQLGLEFVGALDDQTFHNLQKKGIIPERFDFYSDFRLGTIILMQIRKMILLKNLESDTDVSKFLEMVRKALEKECGLIAFGD